MNTLYTHTKVVTLIRSGLSLYTSHKIGPTHHNKCDHCVYESSGRVHPCKHNISS